ncbi:LOW QUALITY PROTEIN: Oaz1p NDAI_0E03000 [Naumovozyma dairenensis CBS 421]|uniref:Ornithine decarboxylase antizyme n=1 Tax=Naumovozyma dairenensis (strain ATCC 10597 / BCRC 20456 / CBS 421 / NBRC 0211 / NRRL Y-12639) TaxID=1071378 RepID=G0WBJ7_NAUDC|nr:LOW QUALITY PROTEIN: hypothetical protein NDAI_0E03000 [Naumovozyma dairenensis CBS 421]CCD25117.1 hypothetical protein NDAI_0E03000 [Naumovozyma dairenensis CBS 421]
MNQSTKKQNLLQKKQDSIFKTLGGQNNLNEKLSNPSISAISLSFPIKNLIKRKQKNHTLNTPTSTSINPNIYTYSLTPNGYKDWSADISRENSDPSNTEADTDKLIELYWDIILLTESQFLYDISHLKKFQNHLVNLMNSKLNQSYKKNTIQDTNNNQGSIWRCLNDNYMIVYLPLIFNDLLWCKFNSVYLNIIIPDFPTSSTINTKDWLLSLLELTSSLDLQYLRLFLRRNTNGNTNLITTLLRNLNWIGGKIIPNENRNNLSFDNDELTMSDKSSFNELMRGDENFIILEFEC